MNICGSVFVSKDVLNFALKCLYCEEDIQEWESFVYHIQSLHNSDLEEPCIDPIVELDYKENNALEWLKDEVMPSTEGDQLDDPINNVDALKVEVPSDGEVCKTEPEEDPVSDNDGDHSYDDDNDSNSDSDSSSNEYLAKSKQKTPKKFKPSFYRNNKNTNVFIEMFEKASCLWDPNDENYNNNTARSKCKTEMIQEMEKRCQITLTYKKLWECFRELHMLYKTVGEAIEKKSGSRYKKLSPTVLGYYEKCSFLSAALDGFLDIFEDTPNTVTNLSFASKNTITIAFIDTYERFPSLYDYKHPDYYLQAKRRQTYKEMADILRIQQNVEFTDDDIFKGIEYMRQWYFKLKKRLGKNLKFESLTKAAQHYVEKLSFLTRRSRGEKRTDTTLQCTECNETFSTNASRQTHLHTVHNIGDMPYKCHLCERSFSNTAALSGHRRRHHTEKVHKCELCDKSYAILADLRNHMGIHTGHKPFICELCGKGFRNKTKLRFHNDAIHLKLRAFKCTMCPKDFLKARDLKDHIKAHLNIRDKICDTCGKDFTSAHGLHRHKQLHAEVKKYACKFCEKRFYQFVGLNSHMKHRHGVYKNGIKRQQQQPDNKSETKIQPQTATPTATNMISSIPPNFLGTV